MVGSVLSVSFSCFPDLVRYWRKKIRRAKGQLEFYLAADVKENENVFYKYISNTRKAKENLHHIMDAGQKYRD